MEGYPKPVPAKSNPYQALNLVYSHPGTESKKLDIKRIRKVNQVQARRLVCMHTKFLRALDHISDCIHARTFKHGMKDT